MTTRKKMIARVMACCGIAVLLALALAGMAHFYLAVKSATFLVTHGHQDTYIFVSAAQRLLAGGKLYELVEPLYVTYAPGMAVFKFPPLYVLPYLPWLDKLYWPEETQWYTWLFRVHLLRYGLAALMVWWCFGPRKQWAWAFTVIAVFGLSAPVHESLYGMTFENLLLFSVVLALVAWQKGWRWPVAALLSYISMAKLFPAPLLLFFATRERWTMIARLAVCSLLWLALAVMLLGVEPHVDYVTRILPVLLKEGANIWLINATLLHDPMIPAGFRPVLACVLIGMTWGVMNFRAAQKTTDRVALEFCMVLLVALLLLKNFWVSYQLVLLLPVLVLAGGMLAGKSLAWWRGLVALMAFVPLLGSMAYGPIELPHYQWFIAHGGQVWMDTLGSARRFSAPLLWVGMVVLVVREAWGNRVLPPKELQKPGD